MGMLTKLNFYQNVDMKKIIDYLKRQIKYDECNDVH